VNDDRQSRRQVIKTVVRTVGIAVVVVAVLVKLIQPGPLILRDWLVPSPLTVIVWQIGGYLLVDYLFHLSKRRLGPRRTDQVVRTVVVGVFVVLVVLFGYAYQWTGFGQSKVAQDVRPAKTLWDWLDLLIVPIVLALGGYFLNSSQTRATQAAAERRAQDDALQAYLDQMSAMLIPKKDQPSLSDEHPPDSLKAVARARTLTMLPRLKPDHKARVVQFLYESGLIAKGRPILDLRGANLIGANLNVADLSWAVLREANLSGANLSEADLGWVRISSSALSRTNLSEADLSSANLSGVRLFDANLIGADLSGADLSGANLSGANLSGAKGWTEEQLAAAQSLTTSTTMPDGQSSKVSSRIP
jgi:hypothetical protein